MKTVMAKMAIAKATMAIMAGSQRENIQAA